MSDSIFNGIFDSEAAAVIQPSDFLLCIGCALLAGIIIAACFMYRSRSGFGFAAALALIPAVVCVVIMMVNGNIGTGVAIAGVFGLVRFRSAPGTAKEICAIFTGMGAGIIVGMGYLAYALLFAVLLGAVGMLYSLIGVISEKRALLSKTLSITIPEDLDYSGVFDDIFKEYTTHYGLVQVKTVNLGSMFRLTYNITLRSAAKEKEMIDRLRCRNGNLEISVSVRQRQEVEL